MTTVATLARLTRYPVKSLQGEQLDAGELRPDGVDGDRLHAFRDLATGRIASAKQPRPWRALLDLTAETDGREVLVRTQTGERWSIDDPRLCDLVTARTARRVEVVTARPGHLGSYDSTWPEVEGVSLAGPRQFGMALRTDAVRFVDVAGLHVITTATLDKLEELSPGSVADARRFRPNLVLDTGQVPPSFLEDDWVGEVLQVGERARIRITTRAPRCVMTTVEQPGLGHDTGILRAAATNRQPFERVGTLACAGVYAEVVVPGPVRIADPVVLA